MTGGAVTSETESVSDLTMILNRSEWNRRSTCARAGPRRRTKSGNDFMRLLPAAREFRVRNQFQVRCNFEPFKFSGKRHALMMVAGERI